MKRGTASVLGLPPDRGQQQWPAGDRLAMMVRIGKPHEQVPPVGHQCHATGHHLAALPILRREAAPAPLVLEFVEVVFAIGPVTVRLAQGEDLGVPSR